VTTSPGLRRPSLGDDVAAWLLLYGAVSEAVIATAALPLPHLTPPRRAGEGTPGSGHYRDVTGRWAVAAPVLRRLASDTAATGAARAGRRLGCAGTCDVGLEEVAAGRGWSRKVRKVNLCCCTAAAPWISRSACYHFRTVSPLLALSVDAGVVGAVDLVWTRRGRRARPLGGARGRFMAIDGFIFLMPVHGSRLLRGCARCLGEGSLWHAATRVVGRPCGARR